MKIAFLATYIAVSVGLTLAFGWEAWLAGGVAATVWLLGSLVRLWQVVRRDVAQQTPGAEIEWLAIGEVEVRVEGLRRRYTARFTAAAPAVDGMSRDERKIAEAHRLLGLPPAVVSTLDKDAPQSQVSEAEEVHVLEIPRASV